MKPKDKRLEFDQSENENRAVFIARLMGAGWSRREAVREWERIQQENGN